MKCKRNGFSLLGWEKERESVRLCVRGWWGWWCVMCAGCVWRISESPFLWQMCASQSPPPQSGGGSRQAKTFSPPPALSIYQGYPCSVGYQIKKKNPYENLNLRRYTIVTIVSRTCYLLAHAISTRISFNFYYLYIFFANIEALGFFKLLYFTMTNMKTYWFF